MTAALHRPAPLTRPEADVADGSELPSHYADRLLAGETLLLSGRYATGRAIYRALRRRLPAPPASAPFEERMAGRKQFLQATRRLVASVRDGAFGLDEAPECGFLTELYPEPGEFWLSFVDVEDLSRAWRYFEEGVPYAVLGHSLHPYYGTYAPTRTEHLELFATWLSGYSGAKSTAVDVGTGSGVLALLMARAGFDRVLATDINPNAVKSVALELERRPAAVEAREADLLEGVDESLDLVVFNPPWTRGTPRRALDLAMVFEDGLFERFFDQAFTKLAPGGRVVLVFSNILQLVQPDAPNPIDRELETGRFVVEERLQRRVKPNRRTHKRTRERVQVWVLLRSE